MRQEIINGIDAILEINHEYEFSKRTGITDSNPRARHYSFNFACENFTFSIWSNYLAERLQGWNPSPVSYGMLILSNKCTVFEGRRTLAGNLKITTDNTPSLMNSEEVELLELLKLILLKRLQYNDYYIYD